MVKHPKRKYKVELYICLLHHVTGLGTATSDDFEENCMTCPYSTPHTRRSKEDYGDVQVFDTPRDVPGYVEMTLASDYDSCVCVPMARLGTKPWRRAIARWTDDDEALAELGYY